MSAPAVSGTRPAPAAVSARQFTVAITAIVLLGSAPFVTAEYLQWNRVSHAREQARAIAAAIGGQFALTTGLPTALVGRGRLPEGDKGSPWFQASPESLDLQFTRHGVRLTTTDPWQQPFFVQLSGNARVVSAGANGMLDTRFDLAAAGGDDVMVEISLK